MGGNFAKGFRYCLTTHNKVALNNDNICTNTKLDTNTLTNLRSQKRKRKGSHSKVWSARDRKMNFENFVNRSLNLDISIHIIKHPASHTQNRPYTSSHPDHSLLLSAYLLNSASPHNIATMKSQEAAFKESRKPKVVQPRKTATPSRVTKNAARNERRKAARKTASLLKAQREGGEAVKEKE